MMKIKGYRYTKHQCVIKSTGTTGKYCVFLNADDILLENALDVSVKKLESDDHLLLCFSRYYFCNEKLEIITHFKAWIHILCCKLLCMKVIKNNLTTIKRH